MKYYTVQSRNATIMSSFVVAPTGYSRRQDGTIYRDGTPSPEMGNPGIAYKFTSRLSAMRSANKLSDPIVTEHSF